MVLSAFVREIAIKHVAVCSKKHNSNSYGNHSRMAEVKASPRLETDAFRERRNSWTDSTVQWLNQLSICPSDGLLYQGHHEYRFLCVIPALSSSSFGCLFCDYSVWLRLMSPNSNILLLAPSQASLTKFVIRFIRKRPSHWSSDSYSFENSTGRKRSSSV